MDIIAIIIIIWIIVRRRRKVREKQGTLLNVPRQPKRQKQTARSPQSCQTPQQAYRAAQPTYTRPKQTGGQSYGTGRYNGGVRQKGATQRLAQWKEQQSQRGWHANTQAHPQPTMSSDILARAAANVRENESDELERQMFDDTQTLNGTQALNADQTVVNEMEGTGALMQEINDLMIMGYQAELSFERDFVAEGVDMLNSYELLTGR